MNLMLKIFDPPNTDEEDSESLAYLNGFLCGLLDNRDLKNPYHEKNPHERVTSSEEEREMNWNSGYDDANELGFLVKQTMLSKIFIFLDNHDDKED